MDESLYLKFYLKLTAILDSGFEKKKTHNMFNEIQKLQ